MSREIELADGWLCWHIFPDGNKRLCDIDHQDEKVAATILLVRENGQVDYACSDNCLGWIRQVDDELLPIKEIGKTVSGMRVFIVIDTIRESRTHEVGGGGK